MPAKLQPHELSEFKASLIESEQLVRRGERKHMSKKAQVEDPAADGTAPMVPPAPPAPAPGAQTAQEQPAPPAPAPAPAPPGPVAQPAPPVDPADGLDDVLELQEQDKDNPMTPEEMGMKPGDPNLGAAKYAHVYGDLRARLVAGKSDLEIFDPATKKTRMAVRLKADVVKNAGKLRKAAVDILAHIAHKGLTATAKRCRGRLYTAESVVDYGMTNMADPIEAGGKDSQAGGMDTKADPLPTPPSTSKDTPQNDKGGQKDRPTGGIGGGAPGVQEDGLNTKAGQPAPPATPQISSVKDDMSNKKNDGPGPIPDDALEGAIDTMSKGAQMEPCDPADPDCDPEEMDQKAASMEELENNLRTYYANKARADVRTSVKGFASHFLRALRLAALRSSMNIESNHLKAAAFDALTSERRISSTEDYIPMDARTAQVLVEASLGTETAISFVDHLIQRAAQLMQNSPEMMAQMEEDLQSQNPVLPDIQGQVLMDLADQMQPEGQMEDPMEQPMEQPPPATTAQEQPPPAAPAPPPAPPGDPMSQAAERARSAARTGNPHLRGGEGAVAKGASIREALSLTRTAAVSSQFRLSFFSCHRLNNLALVSRRTGNTKAASFLAPENYTCP